MKHSCLRKTKRHDRLNKCGITQCLIFAMELMKRNINYTTKTDLRLPPFIWMYFYLLQMCRRHVLALFSCYSWTSSCKYYYLYHLNSYESFTWDTKNLILSLEFRKIAVKLWTFLVSNQEDVNMSTDDDYIFN